MGWAPPPPWKKPQPDPSQPSPNDALFNFLAGAQQVQAGVPGSTLPEPPPGGQYSDAIQARREGWDPANPPPEPQQPGVDYEGIQRLVGQFHARKAELAARVESLRQQALIASKNRQAGLGAKVAKNRAELAAVGKRERAYVRSGGAPEPFKGNEPAPNEFDQLPAMVEELNQRGFNLSQQRAALESNGGSDEDITGYNDALEKFNADIEHAQGLYDLQNMLQQNAIGANIHAPKGSPAATIADFQKKFGLPVTGKNDAITKQAFEQLYQQSQVMPDSPQATQFRQYLHNPNEYLANQREQAKSARQDIESILKGLTVKEGKAINPRLDALVTYINDALGATDAKGRKNTANVLKKVLGGEDLVAIQVAENIRKAVESKSKSEAAGRNASANPLSVIAKTGELVFEPIQRMYYAAQLANRGAGGGGWGAPLSPQALRAGIGAAPGLGFTAGKDTAARRAIEATNTRAEREKLREKGVLPSFGEQALDTLGIPNLEVAGMHPLSGAADLGFQVATDPTLLASVGLGLHALQTPTKGLIEAAAREAGDAAFHAGADEAATAVLVRQAKEAAIVGFLSEPRGQAFVNSINHAIESGSFQNIEQIQRAFPGLSSVDAHIALAARDTADGIRGALFDALAEGRWTPHIRPVEQLAANAGLANVVGKKSVRAGEGALATLRSVGREGESRAATFTHDPNAFGPSAIDSALSKSGGSKLPGDFAKSIGLGEGKLTNRVTAVLRAARKSDDVGLEAYVDQKLRKLLTDKQGLVVGGSWKRTTQTEIAGLIRRQGNAEAIAAVLPEVETILAILDGKAGKAAAEQMRTELAQGFRAGTSDFDALIATGNKSAGAKVGKGTYTEKQVKEMVNALPEGAVRKRAEDQLANTFKKGDFSALGAQVKSVLDNPEALRQAERVAGMEDTRLGAQTNSIADATAQLGGKGLGARAFRGVLGVLEEGIPNQLPFRGGATESEQVAKRVDGLGRLARALELSEPQVARLQADAAKVQTEEAWFKLTTEPYRMAGRDAGVPTDLIDLWVKGTKGRIQRTKVFGINQDTGEFLTGVQNTTQLAEALPILGPEELRVSINSELAKLGEWGPRLHATFNRLGDIQLRELLGRGTKEAGAWTIKGGLEAGHRLWKFFIVSNAQLPVIGLLAGISVLSPQQAAVGMAIGAFGPVRYLGRLVGVEENMRYVLERGFHPQEFIPAISKWASERGISPKFRFADEDAVRSSGFVAGSEYSTGLLSAEKDWTAKHVGQRGFMDDWFRTIEHQIQPEASNVDKVLLSKRAGRITDAEAEELLAQLKKSDEGKIWLSRFKRGVEGPDSWKEAIGRVENQIATYTDPELAGLRLDGELTVDALKGHEPPAFVHAQSRGSVRANTIWRNYTDLVSRGVFSGATNVVNRNRMARWDYADHYDFLTRTGTDPAIAKEIASERAIRHTNETMFRIDAESRFAKKIDFIFPFQQPREEFVRVWGKLIANNPMRTIRMTRLGALAFNNGARMGIFRHDDYTGEWVMTIPGSGKLSQALTGLNLRFDTNLSSLFFISTGGVYGVNFIPTPGGPYWSVISNHLVEEFPKFFEKDSLLSKWLMPYGPGNDLLRPESRRLWAGITGSPAPWSFLDPETIEGEFDKSKINVARSLYAANIKAGMTPEEAWPSEQEVSEHTKDFFKLWAFMGSVSPATPRPVFIDQETYQDIRNKMTLNGTVPLDYAKFTKNYPELTPYITPSTEWNGPDDLNLWTNPLDARKEFELNYKTTIPYDDFKDDFLKYAKEQKAYSERNNIFAMPPGIARDEALMKWSFDHPELASRSRENYFRDRDLAKILTTHPKGEVQENALNRWRLQYHVSRAAYPAAKDRAMKFAPNPWAEARDISHVVKDVEKQKRGGASEISIVSRMNPVEQVHYWDYKRYQLDTNWNPYQDASDVMDQYNYFRKLKNSVFQTNPIITASFADRDNEFDKYVAGLRGQQHLAVSAIYSEIGTVTAAMDEAAQAKDWNAYYALKNKQQTLYDMKRAVVNDLYKRYPELHDVYEDVIASSIALESGNKKKYQQLQSKLAQDKATAGTRFIPTNDEAYYLSLPPNIQKSYIQSLSERLNAPSPPQAPKGADDQYYADASKLSGYLKQQQVSRLHWDTLTQFQQDLLSNNLPADMVRGWALDAYLTQQHYKEGTPFARSKGFTGSAGPEAFDGNPLLKHAYEIMQSYDARGGVQAPGGYQEYLDLPMDPNVRADYLGKHPDVQAYLEAGGFLQMPEADQAIVQSIMLRYAPQGDTGGGGGTRYGGNSGGGYRTSGKSVYDSDGHYLGRTVRGELRPLDVDFAFEQLRQWSRRPDGAMAPETYNIWLNMPRGIEKAAYQKAHPEVEDWIRLGPMANMPDEYQQVVRDIMTRYGYWTAQQDPLGDVINQYYKTPAYARQNFLQQHPELLAYWNSLKTPEELAQGQLADQYFSMQDPTARKGFLMARPELQQYFVAQRDKRYQRFLTQVAMFMGQNPDMFDSYLKQQTDTLNELLRRFGESPYLKERINAPTLGQTGRSRGAGSGRKPKPRPRTS